MTDEKTCSVGADSAVRLAIARHNTLPRISGRRDWVALLDYGVTEATDGRMRVQRAIVTGTPEATGWHYHLCELQYVYMVRGGYTLQFENGETIRLEQGDGILIPGGRKHSEIDISEDFDVLEISIPADMGTRACDVPEYWRTTAEG